jgi:hypothetical protein
MWRLSKLGSIDVSLYMKTPARCDCHVAHERPPESGSMFAAGQTVDCACVGKIGNLAGPIP